METIDNINLTKEKETLFITLRAKALDSRSEHSLLHDEVSNQILQSIRYPFEKHKNFDNDNLTVVRAKQFDEWIKDFIGVNVDGIVLHLGCGLDPRMTRIEVPPTISWYDVDYPEVIALRRNFFSESRQYQMISSSVTDPHWLNTIPNHRPVIIAAEGVLEYIAPDDVKTLLDRLVNYFEHGQLIFDVMSSSAQRAGANSLKRQTGATHQWAIDDLREIDQLSPKLKNISQISLFRSAYIRQLPSKFRLLYGALAFIPFFKNMLRLMRYEF